MRSDIAEIRDRVARLRAALLAPGVDAIEGCIPELQEAVQRLQQIREAVQRLKALDPLSLDPNERALVAALKQDLLRVQSLAASGAAFWEGWARMVGAAAGVAAGYTANGQRSTQAQADACTTSGVNLEG